MTHFSFLQLNMHRALTASVELNKKAMARDTICMITEPCTNSNKICYVPPSYTCLPSTTLEHRPRAAIFLPRHVRHVFLEQLSNRDCVAVLLDTEAGKLLVASLYLDYNMDVVQDWMEELLEYADNKNLPTLLCLDANAHTELYGPETNDRGVVFEEFLTQNNLLIANRGETPTFHTFKKGKNVDTHIDFTLTKRLTPLEDWRVHDMEYNGSDHHTITWTLPVSRPPPLR